MAGPLTVIASTTTANGVDWADRYQYRDQLDGCTTADIATLSPVVVALTRARSLRSTRDISSLATVRTSDRWAQRLRYESYYTK